MENCTISFLITMYKEGEDVVKPLLDSIAIQQNVNFDNIEAIITHDGIVPDDADYKLSDDFINSYPFKITYLQIEHKGVSGARNNNLDHASGDYIIFCDCDDMFFNACGLWMIINEVSQAEPDLYASKFVEEVRTAEDNKPFYINRDNDSTFVHGKVLRRQFLLDNNIRWNEKLTIHEDSFFNCLSQQLAMSREGGYKYTTTAYYLWKWRANSVCRKDPKYLLKTYGNMLESNTALVDEFNNRNQVWPAVHTAVRMIFETYYTINTNNWSKPENKEYLDATEKRFKQYWTKFEYLFCSMPENKKAELAASIRKKFYDQGMLFERITFNDWIKHIEEIED